MRTALMLVAALAGSCASAQGSSDSLLVLTRCFEGTEFRAGQPAHWKGPSRMVDVEGGKARVSVAEGYRIMLYGPGPDPTVNLKFERSQPGRFADDRLALRGQMALLAKRGKGPPMEEQRDNGLEWYGLHNGTLAGGGPVALYTILHEASETVATVYLLPQKGELPAYRTMAEFQRYGLAVLDRIGACMRGGPQAPQSQASVTSMPISR